MTEEKPQATLPLMVLAPMPDCPVAEAPKPIIAPQYLYTAELGAQVCDLIGDDKTLRQIAAMDGMPSTAAIMRWVGKHEDFREMYHFALMARFDAWSDRMLIVARGEPGNIPEKDEPPGEGDKTANDSETPANTDTTTVQGVKQTIQRARLEIETMKWLMGKRLPKTFGEPAAATAEQPESQAPAESAKPPRAVIIGGTDWKKA